MSGDYARCAKHQWGASDPNAPCPYCRIAALEAENERLEYELRVEKGWVRQYRDAYTRLKGGDG